MNTQQQLELKIHDLNMRLELYNELLEERDKFIQVLREALKEAINNGKH